MFVAIVVAMHCLKLLCAPCAANTALLLQSPMHSRTEATPWLPPPEYLPLTLWGTCYEKWGWVRTKLTPLAATAIALSPLMKGLRGLTAFHLATLPYHLTNFRAICSILTSLLITLAISHPLSLLPPIMLGPIVLSLPLEPLPPIAGTPSAALPLVITTPDDPSIACLVDYLTASPLKCEDVSLGLCFLVVPFIYIYIRISLKIAFGFHFPSFLLFLINAKDLN